MCRDCGCQEANKKYFKSSKKKDDHHKHHHDDHDHEHDHHDHHHHYHHHDDEHCHHHHHDHEHHGHHHHHDDHCQHHHHDHHKHSRKLKVTRDLLEKNDSIAEENRRWFMENHMKVVNMMSSPGAGKTALLEKTVELIKDKKETILLVGDQQTDNDAQRLLNKGAKVKQINTYSSCHLDAQMIEKEIDEFVTGREKLLIIENIGNLVCPAAFDLGEEVRVALVSTTEGEDKPIKYPVLFHRANVVLITKVDLIPHLDWDREMAYSYIRQINPSAQIIEVSSKTGVGMDAWCNYLLSL